MTYEDAREYIAGLQKRGWRLGLDRMRELLAMAGNPELTAQCFHIAGTNGKGSVTAMLASILRRAGYRAGAFFSPYVYEFRERIQVDGQFIPESDVARLTDYLLPFSEELETTELGGPTEFEFKTAMGFLYWQERKCDFVALEVGLGGRLDATNVITQLVSVITEIGLDHQEHLGETMKEIAGEKAGIIKPHIPSISGAGDKDAQDVIRMVADLQSSELWQVGKEITIEKADESWTILTPAKTRANLKTNLLGDFQARNIAAACGALDAAGVRVDDDVLRDALLEINLPGRMEVVRESPLVVFDGAHNGQSAAALAKSIPEVFGKNRVRLVYARSSGHNGAAVTEALRPITEAVYATQMEHPRAEPLKELLDSDIIPVFERGRWFAFTRVGDALEAALHDCGADELVLVTGSFFLLSEAKQALSAITLIR